MDGGESLLVDKNVLEISKLFLNGSNTGLLGVWRSKGWGLPIAFLTDGGVTCVTARELLWTFSSSTKLASPTRSMSRDVGYLGSETQMFCNRDTSR